MGCQMNNKQCVTVSCCVNVRKVGEDLTFAMLIHGDDNFF